jgi:hypothetical protein
MARLLILIGILLILAGLLWPWLTRLGLGHLPGDIHIEREHFSFHFPIVTSLVLSVLLSLILWLLNK